MMVANVLGCEPDPQKQAHLAKKRMRDANAGLLSDDGDKAQEPYRFST